MESGKHLETRAATPRDAQQLTGLARRAKAHWGYPREWMDAWRSELTVMADYIGRHRVILLEEQREIAGFYGLEFRGDVAHLEHLWVEPAYIGRGLGRALLAMACSDAKERGYATIELIADPHAESFYLHHGATRVGEVHGVVLGTPRVVPKMRLDVSRWDGPQAAGRAAPI